MTTFSYPILTKPSQVGGPGTLRVVQAVRTTVDIGRTGTAVGATTVPLFTMPAGSTIERILIDVVDGYDNAIGGTNLTLGVAGAPARYVAATSVNTARHVPWAPTSALASAAAVPLPADTVLNATVSIQTSAVTAGRVLLTVTLL